jgi:hypothetical protein
MNTLKRSKLLLTLLIAVAVCVGDASFAMQKVGASDSALDLGDLNLSRSEMRGVIERFVADRGSLARFYTVQYSPSRASRLKEFYTEWLAGINDLNFDSMSHEGQVDYLLFRNQLQYEIQQLDLQARQFAEIEPLVPFARQIMGLEEARRRMEPVNAQKTAALINGLNKQIADSRKAVEAAAKADPKPAVKKAVANRAALAVNSLTRTLKDWFGFYDGYDPVFSWWVSEPYKQLDKSLVEYAGLLREKVAGVKPEDANAIIGDPIGREALLIELAREMIPYTPEELLEIANKEMAWCENEMKRASRDLGYGDDWHKALEHVKTLHVEPGKQPEMIRELALEAIEFVEKHDLVSVPKLARDTWRMEMLSPERQLVSPFFLGGEVIQVSFPTSGMQHEQKMMSMRGNNRHFSRATVHHELIPGHHLQGFMAQRYKPYRALFGTPFWTEGWALYWEMLLWDMNFPRSAEDRIGMLFWRMHRCARIIFSLGFHLEQMTPEQSIELLVKRVGHEPDNATAEVRRSFNGTYPPLYQCAYMIGGLQFRALQKEMVSPRRMTNRAFHDRVLRENRIPVEMIRATLTGQKLTRDYRPGWRFYSLANR